MTNFKTSAAFIFVIFLSAIVILLLRNNNKYTASKTSVTIYETYQQPEVLPVMAEIDFQADTGAAANFSRSVNWLLNTRAEPVKLDVNDYLGSDQQNTLFHHFVTNVKKSGRKSPTPFIKSSFLGFSSGLDTNIVNKILTDAGFTKYGTMLRWVPYDSAYRTNSDADLGADTSYWGLVASNPSARRVTINIDDIKEVKVKQMGDSFFWNFIDRLKGKADYCVAVSFTDRASDKIRSSFLSDSSVLVRLNYNDKEYYNSFAANRIENGVGFLNEVKN